MNVVIENCRSIDNASISIEPGKLNVKFAPNGTGKSSIAKALVSAVSESIGPDLVPFKWQKEGSAEKHPFNVSGLNGIASVFSPSFSSKIACFPVVLTFSFAHVNSLTRKIS